MIHRAKITAVAILLLVVCVACGGADNKTAKKLDVPNAVLTTESDSLAYMIGVSMAQNALKTDPQIDLKIVAAAMVHCADGNALFTPDYARSTYLKYMLHIQPERQRSYEEQYLKELAAADRSYTRTKSGVTYNASKIGEPALMARNNNDWVELNYTISDLDGNELYSSHTDGEVVKSAVVDLPKSLQECVKLIGRGGQVSALVPSKYAYDGEGNEELGITPYQTLRFDVEVVQVEKGAANKYTKNSDPATF